MIVKALELHGLLISNSCWFSQALPLAMATLFEQEMHEANQDSNLKISADPSTSACIVMVLFVLWYGSARRVPQSAALSMLQLQRFDSLHSALEMLYPEKDWSFTKKYHNMGHHVHPVGFALGGWELASTNVFEMENKFMKHVASFHTNRKDYHTQVRRYMIIILCTIRRMICCQIRFVGGHAQIMARELRRFTADVCQWMVEDGALECGYNQVKSLKQKAQDKVLLSEADRESSGIHFPLHELLKRNVTAIVILST